MDYRCDDSHYSLETVCVNKVFQRNFFERDARIVARNPIGKYIVQKNREGNLITYDNNGNGGICGIARQSKPSSSEYDKAERSDVWSSGTSARLFCTFLKNLQ